MITLSFLKAVLLPNFLLLTDSIYLPDFFPKIIPKIVKRIDWTLLLMHIFFKNHPKNCQENWLNFTFDAFRLKKNELLILYSIWLLLYSMGPKIITYPCVLTRVWIEKVTLKVVVCHQQIYIFHNIILETFLWKNVLIAKVFEKVVRRYTIFWHNVSSRQVYE